MTRTVLRVFLLVATAAAMLGGSCGGGGGGDDGSPACDGSCSNAGIFLASTDVERILSQAVAEATRSGVSATIAVVDRVGNVLAVFRMTGALTTTLITTGRGVQSGLEGLNVESELAAISKAGTAAYLSSQGNAFTSRTANQILQQNFNPGELNQAGGPLFGVQISQLPCGDLVKPFDTSAMEGPKPMPLGFSADPGGLPLYRAGVPVGGVGVELDGIYGVDANVLDIDDNLEERIASAASWGFAAPEDRRANRIAVNGRFLRFADDLDFSAQASDVVPFADIVASGMGSLVSVPFFFGNFDPANPLNELMPPVALAGAEFLTPASGIVRSDATFGLPAEILVDSMSIPRFPPMASGNPLPAAMGGSGLSAAEVTTVVREALSVAARARSQIRRPTGSTARVNVSVVDLDGTVLGFGRSPDAPVFGADVSLQKARTAAFFSMVTAGADLSVSRGDPRAADPTLAPYVTAVRSFLGNPAALANGTAFSDRAGGNLSRPFFPDGINGNSNGPFSRPFNDWSPFSTGLQVDSVFVGLAFSLCPLVRDVRVTLSAIVPAIDPNDPATCSAVTPALMMPPPATMSCTDPTSLSEARNGFQIFPGSVPIFRGGELIGGIGISGDGVDQDDLVAFLGVDQAGDATGGAINNAPPAIRADTISVQVSGSNVFLRFVSCPPAPFLNSNEQNVCEGR